MKTREATFVAATVALALVTGPALATPPSPGVVGVVVARGDFADPVDIKLKVTEGSQEVIHAPNARQTVMQSIVFSPGAHTGWHSHPGPVVVLVKSGELTLYASHDGTCEARTYTTGQAFIDRGQGHAHIGVNTAAGANTELWVTYFDVPPGGAFRINADDPGNCGF
jgi:quercetin dioxygenase-like cupin family protein